MRLLFHIQPAFNYSLTLFSLLTMLLLVCALVETEPSYLYLEKRKPMTLELVPRF